MVSSGNGKGPEIVEEHIVCENWQLSDVQNPSTEFHSLEQINRSDHNLPSPAELQQRNVEQQSDETSTSSPPPRMQRFMKWLRKPFNMVAFLFTVFVLVLALLSLLISKGVLNAILPEKSTRDVWTEALNQFRNAIVTIVCLYQHPLMFRHLVLLCRWRERDAYKLRKLYCKNGAPEPHDRDHIAVVVVLIHIGCFVQYAICALTWGYKRSERPGGWISALNWVANVSGVVAIIYYARSPLRRDHDSEEDDEEAQERRKVMDDERFTLVPRNGTQRGAVEKAPKWRGGLFDMREDLKGACLSAFCTSCVFGWNMERLGFGDVYCQTMTFILFHLSPFLVFNLAAIRNPNHSVRITFCVFGALLSILGFLYGGAGRILMRKRFSLPGSNCCFGKPNIADCLQWLCCCCCSLAQEVRTVDFYDIVLESEENHGRNQGNENENGDLTTLRAEEFRGFSKLQPAMRPPVSSKMQKEDDNVNLRRPNNSFIRQSYENQDDLGNGIGNLVIRGVMHVKNKIAPEPAITEEGEGSRHWLLSLENPLRRSNKDMQNFNPTDDNEAFNPSRLQQIMDHEQRDENLTSVPPSELHKFKKWLRDPFSMALLVIRM
ncbi:hypothetical protein Ancab_031489 [Ancistrocladus abbreviatus]